MTKQEEIREGVAEKIFEWQDGYKRQVKWSNITGFKRGEILAITDIILEYEDSQGVVIKVDRELPFPALQKDCENCVYKELVPCPYKPRGFNHCKHFKNFQACYVATEPLIG